jgi:hypothetical protein
MTYLVLSLLLCLAILTYLFARKKRPEPCVACRGKGRVMTAWSEVRDCKECNGKGIR